MKNQIKWIRRDSGKLPRDGERTLWYFADKDQVGVSAFYDSISGDPEKGHDTGWMVEYYNRSAIVNQKGEVEEGGFGFWPFVTHWARLPLPEKD